MGTKYVFNPTTGNLDATDVVAFNGEVDLGTAAAPSVFFTGDPNTGIYSPGADQVAISSNGVGRLFIDASGNIKVSTGEIFNTSATGYIRIAGGDDGGSGANILAFGQSHGSAAGRLVLTAVGSESMQFGAGGAERMRLDSSGRLGLGTSSPGSYVDYASKLVVANAAGNNGMTIVSASNGVGALFFADGTVGNEANRGGIYYSHIDDSLQALTAGSARVHITSGGNVGLGTSTPEVILDVNAVSGDAKIQVKETTTNGLLQLEANTSYNALYGTGSKPLYLYSNGSIGLTLDSSQRVGIGVTSPGQALHVLGKGRFQEAASSGAIAYIGANATEAYIDTGTYSTNQPLVFKIEGTERARITSDGKVGIGTTAPSYILDIRTDANSNQLAYIANANTGSSAAASLTAATGAGDISVRAHSAAHSVWPSTGLIQTTSGLSGGLAINSAGSTALQFLTNSTERARIDSSGRLLVGTSSARTNVNGYQPIVQVEVASSSDAINRYASYTYGRLGAGSFTLAFNRHASSTVGGQDIVGAGYVLGNIEFNGSDGTNFISGAEIKAEVDGTPGANDMPGRLVFSTTADGASSPTERMRIKNDGTINFSNVAVYADNAAAKTGGLVDGDVYRTSTGDLKIVYT